MWLQYVFNVNVDILKHLTNNLNDKLLCKNSRFTATTADSHQQFLLRNKSFIIKTLTGCHLQLVSIDNEWGFAQVDDME